VSPVQVRPLLLVKIDAESEKNAHRLHVESCGLRRAVFGNYRKCPKKEVAHGFGVTF